MSEAAKAGLKRPPIVSGAQAEGGHMPEFEKDYCAFISRAHAECGELAEFDFGGQETILMSGPDAQEVFFRTPDEVFSQAQASGLKLVASLTMGVAASPMNCG